MFYFAELIKLRMSVSSCRNGNKKIVLNVLFRAVALWGLILLATIVQLREHWTLNETRSQSLIRTILSHVTSVIAIELLGVSVGSDHFERNKQRSADNWLCIFHYDVRRLVIIVNMTSLSCYSPSLTLNYTTSSHHNAVSYVLNSSQFRLDYENIVVYCLAPKIQNKHGLSVTWRRTTRLVQRLNK